MKKLLLGLAFCFSMGAFAQTPTTPGDNYEPCLLMISENSASYCWPIASIYNRAPGTFLFSICGSLAHKSQEEINQIIFDHLCEYQTLPSDVSILSFDRAEITTDKK